MDRAVNASLAKKRGISGVDNDIDTLTFAQFQCFDFQGMDKFPTLLEPLLFYLLHRANQFIYDPDKSTTFKLFVMDEAWRFFTNQTIRDYLTEALKTWRKHNAAVVLATQSAADLNKSEILEIVCESCPTKIYLANKGMNAQAYKELFHLNDVQAEVIRDLTAKRQLFLSTPTVSKILTLDVDPRSYWIFTNNPTDNAKRAEALADHRTLSAALDALVRSQG